jgi:hypothetical protein
VLNWVLGHFVNLPFCLLTFFCEGKELSRVIEWELGEVNLNYSIVDKMAIRRTGKLAQ